MPRSYHASMKKQLDQQLFLQLTDILSGNLEFVSTIRSSGYQNVELLNQIITTHATAIGFTSLSNNAPPIQYVVSRLGSLDRTILSEASSVLLTLFQATTTLAHSEHHRRHNVAVRMGLLSNPLELPVIRLSRLPNEYPPRNHFVFENTTDPIPFPPRLRDPTCGYCTNFHRLDVSQLVYTLHSNQSALFVDADTGEKIAVVIRSFAQSYFSVIQEWAVNLIRNSINRRSRCQRNNPGDMARVGVSDGARNARQFGWVLNLIDKFKKAFDFNDHEQNISSLFGIFYALLRSQIPWLAEEYENAMSSINLPRLDQTQLEQFTIPFANTPPITFQGYPLAPPEGYIAIDFCKEIHKDTHWYKCPWGSYWNILRTQLQGKVGLESGASFFISDYGLRIVNASNTFVAWDISLWHGTGWYDTWLSHCGIATLLSRATEKSWKDYQAKVMQGELKNGDLLWYPENEASS